MSGEPYAVITRSGQDLERFSAFGSICLKVGAVYRYDLKDAHLFRGPHERCVGEIHRMIGVPLHQLDHPGCTGGDLDDLKPATLQEVQHGYGQVLWNQVRRFGQHWPGRVCVTEIIREEIRNPFVVRVVPIEQGNQRARINENAQAWHATVP